MARSAWKVSKRGAYSIESRRRAPARRRLTRWGGGIEALEDRTLLATDVWTGADSSSWSDGGNWSLGASPGVSDVASFTNSGTGVSLFSATVDSASSISGLLIDGSWNGTLTFHAALSLSGASQLSGGTLD